FPPKGGEECENSDFGQPRRFPPTPQAQRVPGGRPNASQLRRHAIHRKSRKLQRGCKRAAQRTRHRYAEVLQGLRSEALQPFGHRCFFRQGNVRGRPACDGHERYAMARISGEEPAERFGTKRDCPSVHRKGGLPERADAGGKGRATKEDQLCGLSDQVLQALRECFAVLSDIYPRPVLCRNRGSTGFRLLRSRGRLQFVHLCWIRWFGLSSP